MRLKCFDTPSEPLIDKVLKNGEFYRVVKNNELHYLHLDDIVYVIGTKIVNLSRPDSCDINSSASHGVHFKELPPGTRFIIEA